MKKAHPFYDETPPALSPSGAEASLAGLPDLEGEEIEKWRLLRCLGHGGMSVVYEAEHIWLAQKAAIKLLRPHISLDPDSLERFRREAFLMSQLAHPNIIEIKDFGIDPEHSSFMVMELLEGSDLAQLFHRGRLPKAPDFRGWLGSLFGQLYEALEAIHKAQVIHRDLKPSNIFLVPTDEGQPLVKLLDFGIAKLLPSKASGNALTHTGMILGTPHYLAPEQLKARPKLSPATDIYASGVILYELLSGQLPIEGEGPVEQMMQVASQQPPPLGSLRKDLAGTRLEALVMRMLSKSASDRPSTARHAREELLLCLSRLQDLAPAPAKRSTALSPTEAPKAPPTPDSEAFEAPPEASPHETPAPSSPSPRGLGSTLPLKPGGSKKPPLSPTQTRGDASPAHGDASPDSKAESLVPKAESPASEAENPASEAENLVPTSGAASPKQASAPVRRGPWLQVGGVGLLLAVAVASTWFFVHSRKPAQSGLSPGPRTPRKAAAQPVRAALPRAAHEMPAQERAKLRLLVGHCKEQRWSKALALFRQLRRASPATQLALSQSLFSFFPQQAFELTQRALEQPGPMGRRWETLQVLQKQWLAQDSLQLRDRLGRLRLRRAPLPEWLSDPLKHSHRHRLWLRWLKAAMARHKASRYALWKRHLQSLQKLHSSGRWLWFQERYTPPPKALDLALQREAFRLYRSLRHARRRLDRALAAGRWREALGHNQKYQRLQRSLSRRPQPWAISYKAPDLRRELLRLLAHQRQVVRWLKVGRLQRIVRAHKALLRRHRRHPIRRGLLSQAKAHAARIASWLQLKARADAAYKRSQWRVAYHAYRKYLTSLPKAHDAATLRKRIRACRCAIPLYPWEHCKGSEYPRHYKRK